MKYYLTFYRGTKLLEEIETDSEKEVYRIYWTLIDYVCDTDISGNYYIYLYNSATKQYEREIDITVH